MSAFDWEVFLRQYLMNPAVAWGSASERQVVKLEKVFSIADTRYGMNRVELADCLVEAVRSRESRSQSPVYVVNLGGCGSHWITRMLAQASDLVDAGEVYLPPSWYAGDDGSDGMARVLDGVELAHTLLYGSQPADFFRARVVNSAHGSQRVPFYRLQRPDCIIVHLVRDPRDRATAVTFRKSEFRAYENIGLEDYDYLLAKARRDVVDWVRFKRMGADIVIRYEDFVSDAASELSSLLTFVGAKASPSLSRVVAKVNGSEYLRSSAGQAFNAGNLSSGGEHKGGWRTLPYRYQRALHAVVCPVLSEQGYPFEDCFPGDELTRGGYVQARDLQPFNKLTCDVQLLECGKWQRLEGIDGGALATRVRIRVESLSDLPRLSGLDLSRVTDLCCSGLVDLGTEDLKSLGDLASLMYLDCSQTRIADLPWGQFPRLLAVNVSGCDDWSDRNETIDVFRDF